MKWKLFALAPLLTLTLAAAPHARYADQPGGSGFCTVLGLQHAGDANWKVVRSADRASVRLDWIFMEPEEFRNGEIRFSHGTCQSGAMRPL
ncbi:MAG: hypothetical protein V8T87_00680 [Victivallales bacterium]